MKKIISVLLVALLVMGLIVGCGGNQASKETGENEETEKQESKGPVFVNIVQEEPPAHTFPLVGLWQTYGTILLKV